MAWFKTGSGAGGGGGLTETILWTNNAPSSDFAATTVSLSEDIDNYDYIKIYYKPHKTSSIIKAVIYETSFVKESATGKTDDLMGLCAGYKGASSTTYWCRRVFYDSDTALKFNTGERLASSGTDISYCIPTQICGLK